MPTVTAVEEPRQDKSFNVVNYVVLSIFLLVVLYPLVFIISASISSPIAVSSGEVWLWPVDITFNGYQAAGTCMGGTC